MKKSIFVICSVRDADDKYRAKLENYVRNIEEDTQFCVHLPHRDTNQEATSIEICKQNYNAIKDAYAVSVFYNSKSQGTHFDLGVAFALGKEIRIIENEEVGIGKSFPKMLTEWVDETCPICDHNYVYSSGPSLGGGSYGSYTCTKCGGTKREKLHQATNK